MPFTIKPINNIVSDILFNITQNVPDITDLNPGSVLRTMVEALSLEVDQLYTELNNVFEGTRIDTSTGDDLENLGALVGITRKAGTQTTGNITFSRIQEATGDFTIAAAAIISTQPNTGEEQLRFTVDANTVFDAEITDETQSFRDGILDYRLTERFIGSIQSVDGTSSAAPFVFVEATDFDIVKNVDEILIVDTSTITIVDSNDIITGWTGSVDTTAIATDIVEFREGGVSLKLGKSGITTTVASYEKILGGVVDGSAKDLVVWVFIKDQFTLNKIANIGLLFGSGGSDVNSFSLAFSNTRLIPGWQQLRFETSDSTVVRAGTPSETAVNFLRVTINTNLITDTLVAGDVNMDYWIFAETDDFTGDIIRFKDPGTGTKPDDATDILVDYKPLSKEVACTAELVGIKFNVGANKVIFKVSIIGSIDSVNNFDALTGGTNEETDDELRERIQLATQVQAKATTTALQQSVLAVEGVVSVAVDDLPRKSQSLEPILFATGTDDYGLEFEVAVDNATLVVSATVSATPATILVNGVDYILEDSTIKFQALGTKPDNATIFFVTYDFDFLGHVEMFVSGTTTPLTTTVLAAITTAIDDTKAAGIVVDFFEPTVISVAVTLDILADITGGFTFAAVADAVDTAVETFLNTKDVGSEVFIAEIIDVVMDVPGVLNTVVIVPAADVTIANDEIAKAGTIIVGSL